MYLQLIMKRNCGGQQFHQYQQNEQSPLNWTQKDHKIWRWKSRYRHKNVAGFNRL